MARSLNRTDLIGNLGADPELHTFDAKRSKATLSIATNRSYRNDKGDLVTNTQWHRVIAWNGLAKFASEYLRKGARIFVSGELTYRTYEDATGTTRYVTEIVAREIIALDGARSESTEAESASRTPALVPGDDEEEDLPF